MCNPTPQKSNESKQTANKKWCDISSRLPVPKADPTPKEVDVKKFISAQDLNSLKKRDPFLYYSIPDVREATIRLAGEGEDVDMHQVALEGLMRHSFPTSIKTSCESEPVAKVKRRTRLSFECHADLILADLLLELDERTDAD